MLPPLPALLGGSAQWSADGPPEGAFAVAAADTPPAPDVEEKEEEEGELEDDEVGVLRGFRLQYLVP